MQVNQQLSEVENPSTNKARIYELLNLKAGGRLIELYNENESEGVRKFCEEDIHRYNISTYSRHHRISELEYHGWRDLRKNKISLQDEHHYQKEEKDFNKLMVENFKCQGEHEACCTLDSRGGVGETLLHLCFLNGTPAHIEISKVLLNLYPAMVMDIYELDEYYGESALHFAVINEDIDSVRLLIEAKAKVDQRATGLFFLPTSVREKRIMPAEYHGSYSGDAYLGEYPLAFALCCESKPIYNYLLLNGADPNSRDSFGNTVLHLAVIKNLPDMYVHAIQTTPYGCNDANSGITNCKGLTPLALACKLGRRHMFDTIMKLRQINVWTFSNVQCSRYPMQEVESIDENGAAVDISALQLTVNGESDEHMEMCQYGVVRELISLKWRYYVKYEFIWRLMVVVAHLLVQLCAISLRNTTDLTYVSQDLPETPQQNEYPIDIARFIMELLSLGFCVFTVILHCFEIAHLGPTWFFNDMRRTPYRAIYGLGCVLFIICLPIRLAAIAETDLRIRGDLRIAEETLLLVAIPLMWAKLLFFAELHSSLGPLIAMLVLFFHKDLREFIIIAALGFICFGSAFYLLFRSISDEVSTFRTAHGTLMSLFHYMFGEFEGLDTGYMLSYMTYGFQEPDEFLMTKLPSVTMTVFVFFMMCIPILMLNMLIARMTNTFHKVISKAEKQAVQHWCRVVLVLERTVAQGRLKRYKTLYTIMAKGEQKEGQPQDPKPGANQWNKELNAAGYIQTIQTIKKRRRKILPLKALCILLLSKGVSKTYKIKPMNADDCISGY